MRQRHEEMKARRENVVVEERERETVEDPLPPFDDSLLAPFEAVCLLEDKEGTSVDVQEEGGSGCASSLAGEQQDALEEGKGPAKPADLWTLKAMYFTYYGALAFYMPFLPLYLQSICLS